MHIDYYFALSSPFSYMGHERFRQLQRTGGLSVAYKPVEVPKVFAVSGGLPVAQRPPQRQAYRFMELRRWRERLGIPLNLEPRHFPVAEQQAARTVVAAVQQGADPHALALAYMRAVWSEERDIADPATIEAILGEAGYDADLLAAADSAAVTEGYELNTQEAIDRGVFGVPTWAIGDELFWGQDRLDFVEAAIRRG